MEKYKNRRQAGQVLAQALEAYANRPNVIVLALPRGGVPVAYEITKALCIPLDIFIVRKLGVPGHEELAIGAIAMGGATTLNQEVIHSLNISAEQIEAVRAKEEAELQRRESAYRGDRPFPLLKNKIIILVDDGIATGATIRVAVKALRQLQPKKIIVAVPVAEKKLSEQMQTLADEFICPLKPVNFYAVGAWYEDFPQTEDEEVHKLLDDTLDNHSKD